MSFPYSSDAAGDRVIFLLRDLLKSDRIYISANRHLIFLCGGDRHSTNLRSKFLEFAKTALPHLHLILAEDALADMQASSGRAFQNLARFERLLAGLADCIVIFPESAGSIAELGFFSAFGQIARKLLAANSIEFQAQDSFINLGPIAIINEESDFRPTLHLTTAPAPDFSPVAKRLQRYETAQRRMKFSHKPFISLEQNEKFFLVSEVIRTLRVIHIATLPRAIQLLLGDDPDRLELKSIIAVLVASRFVHRRGEESRYLVAGSGRPFLESDDFEKVIIESNKYLLSEHTSLYSEVFKD